MGKFPDRDHIWISEFLRLGWLVIPYQSRVEVEGNNFFKKIKKRLSIGNEFEKMRSELIDLCIKEKPIWIHFRLPIEFGASTIKKLKKISPVLTQYFNDDPFSKIAPIGLYLRFKSAIPHYDISFVYRYKNINNFKRAKSKEVLHLPPMYVPTHDKNRHSIGSQNFIADAAFVGHWENDNRVRFLSEIVNFGLKLIVRGGMWEKGVKGTPLEKFSPITSAFGDEYKNIYSNAVAGICFFSKINNDGLNRRALEIIEMGGVLVCERTEEAMKFFEEGKEALFFETHEELIECILKLKNNPVLRKKIKLKGYNKLIKSKSSIKDRAEFIDTLVKKKLIKN